jgi:hypothetical protein
MRQASTRQIVVSLGILVLLVLSVAGFLVVAVTELEGTTLELQAREAEYEILKRRAPSGPPPGTTMAGDPYLAGATLALAGNALQQRLVGIVESTGGTLRSVAVEPPQETDEPGPRRALVQASASMTIGALQTLLYRLETETPFAFVEGLTVQRAGNLEAEPRVAGIEPEPVLNVELRVAGFWRGASS